MTQQDYTQHWITPPPELVSKWTRNRGYSCSSELWDYLATQAAQWGAEPEPDRPTDEELLMLYGLTTKHLIESGRGACNHLTAFARAVLARWGCAAPPAPYPPPKPPMTDQFPGATKKVLSPAAQAVLDAYANELMRPGPLIDKRHPIAAALVAAADQVVPSDAMEPRNYLPMALECQRIREEILAIAAELESQ